MVEEREQSPHYIPELDPENKRFSGQDTGVLIYVILSLLPFSIGGTFFGVRNDDGELLGLGMLSIFFTLLSIIAIFVVRGRRNSQG